MTSLGGVTRARMFGYGSAELARIGGSPGCGAMTFWEFIHHDVNYQAASTEVGPLLKQLHAVPKNYPGELPYLNPVLGKRPHFLAYLELAGELDASDLAQLRRASQQTALALRDPSRPVQALHGDAHKTNLLKTARGHLFRPGGAGYRMFFLDGA
jgi:hypothetical protein